jgi:hypothetical protein
MVSGVISFLLIETLNVTVFAMLSSGRITYLHAFGQGLVFLNTPEAALALLDKRGAIYSDKPRLVMAGELCVCLFPYYLY